MISTNVNTSFGTFFLPGPTEVRPEILAAMQRPMIAHRGRTFETLFAGIEAGLRDVFLTGRPVYVSTSSASGLMEGAIRNAPVGPILCLVNGAFSDRFAKIAAACAREVVVLSVPWGATFDLDAVESMLTQGSAGTAFAAVTVVHSETSTGVLSDVRAIAALAHAHDAMCIVDSVTGVGGAELTADAWELDLVLTGSQKALALPPGLAFAVARPNMLERAKAKTARGVYFDLLEFESYILKNQTPNTPALSLFYALDAQMKRIETETIEARWARHAAMARRTAEWAGEMRGKGIAIEHIAPEGVRSPTVSCLRVPEGTTGTQVNQAMKDRGFTIATGYGKLKDATIRIGHMGDHPVDELAVVLGELEAVLEALRTR